MMRGRLLEIAKHPSACLLCRYRLSLATLCSAASRQYSSSSSGTASWSLSSPSPTHPQGSRPTWGASQHTTPARESEPAPTNIPEEKSHPFSPPESTPIGRRILISRPRRDPRDPTETVEMAHYRQKDRDRYLAYTRDKHQLPPANVPQDLESPLGGVLKADLGRRGE
ncbi:hypothetical protein B0T24DRAFT_223806 [Lasiosphaeria ovina]|uniref:Uncharacterized protein n=1 Tax=Lasiosphaeria ovina TaxID=92902 RepID=A0AAE0NBK9_9PEZI|nr:hypothetical protein B0T24DRAFT_223806 [Lasiosphaeria ovina]